MTPLSEAVATERARFSSDVSEYLQRTPRQLPSKYFYDALGSALFDSICRLPWYRITRAELGLLASHADEILRPLASPFDIGELGCGNGEKLAWLLQHGNAHVRQIHLIDLSAAALDAACTRLLGAAEDIHASVVSYEEGLSRIVARRAGRQEPLALLFLGSNIGNFDREEAETLLARVRRSMRPGDVLLLGSDLVKPERELLMAYDDPLGVTAAFNLNLLRRINDELSGTFDLAGFEHRAVWNAPASRVEMHLVSRRRQEVRVGAAELRLTFSAGESIWTESSYKYEPEGIVAQGTAAGFTRPAQWIDAEARFALTRFSV